MQLAQYIKILNIWELIPGLLERLANLDSILNYQNTPAVIECRLRLSALLQLYILGGFIRGILRGVRCTKSLGVLFLHRRPPSWTTLVLYSRAVFIFNER